MLERSTTTVTGAADVETLMAVIDSYPGPALWLSRDGTLAGANAVSADLLEGDPRLLTDIVTWTAQSRVMPGIRSVLVDSPRGPMVIEWAATPLPDGGAVLFGRDSTLERQLRLTLTESRQRYKDLVEVSSDFAWETGADGRFVFVTPRGALGYEVQALIGTDPNDLTDSAFGDLPLPFVTRTPIDQVELWLKRADGAPACVVASALPLHDADGGWAGARGVCRDITEQTLRSHELTRIRDRERLLARIVRTLRDRLDPGDALGEAAADAARALSAAGCRIYRQNEAGALDVASASDAGIEDHALSPVLARMVAGGALVEMNLAGTRVLAHPTEYSQSLNGAVLVWRDAAAAAWDDDDRALMEGIADHVGVAHAHLAYQDRLRRLSERDGLTGLFNRRTFYERLEEALARPDTGPSALLYVDLDNFKAVNDLLGHQQGDAVLIEVARLLSAGVRPGDIAGRVGGDEFVLWLGRSDAAKAEIVATRLLAGAAALRPLSASPDRPLGLSIGIAIHWPGRSESVQELADRADQAMYAAKSAGKNSFASAADRAEASSARERQT